MGYYFCKKYRDFCDFLFLSEYILRSFNMFLEYLNYVFGIYFIFIIEVDR